MYEYLGESLHQKLAGLYQETLDEYILHLTQLMEKIWEGQS